MSVWIFGPYGLARELSIKRSVSSFLPMSPIGCQIKITDGFWLVSTSKIKRQAESKPPLSKTWMLIAICQE